MEHNDKIKKAFWITEDMDREIDAHLKQDNCSSRSEFVMNALKFYIGYMNSKNASAFLPEVLSATLTGTLDGFAGRISSLLFKQGVDINLMAQIIAYDTDIDEGAYVITHCAPTSIALMENRHNKADSLTDFLEKVKERANYHYWLFGHYHDNRAIDEKHIQLWEQIVQVI